MRQAGKLAAGAVTASLAAAPAAAQFMEEIVVTARKVEESLQDVPLAITAFSAATIEAAGIRDLYDVAALTPGLSFFNAQGEFLAVPVIRGVAPTDIFGENNAAIFVDGVFVSGRRGLNFSQLDLERIEVVKGPQSALYGRNAFSGAINYVTRRPTDEFEARAEVTAGNDERRGGSASVSGPIIGSLLSGRIAALVDSFGGSYDNALAPETDIGGYRYRSVQGSLAFRPAERLEMYGSLYYSNDGIDDSPTTGIPANCEPSLAVEPGTQRLLNFCGRIRGIDGAAIPKIAAASGEDREIIRGSLVVDWQLDYGSLTFLTGYSDTRQEALVDGNRSLGEDLPLVYCTAGFGINCIGGEFRRFTTGLLQITREDQVKEFSQEIRFTSPQDRPLRYTTGAYYYDVGQVAGTPFGAIRATQPQPADVFAYGPFAPVGAVQIAIGNTIYGPWFLPNGSVDPLDRRGVDNDTSAWAVFGGMDYDLTDRLTGRSELRYSREKKTNRSYQWDIVNLDVTEPTREAIGRKSFDQWSGRLGLDFRVSEQWMVYGSLARGVKAGGFSPVVGTARDNVTQEAFPVQLQVPFAEETILAWEVGAKGSLADGRLQLNMAMFLNDWDDVVVRRNTVEDPVTGLPLSSPVGIGVNVGDARVWGWEFEADFLLTEHLSGRLAASYTDAKLQRAPARDSGYEDFPSFGPDGSLAGNTLLRQPKWNASASLGYQRPLASGWDFYGRGDLTFQDRVFVGIDNQSWLPSQTHLNLRLGIENARYSVEIWGRNLLDDDSPVAAYRDVFFTNTDDYSQSLPVESTTADLFPFRYTVTHPRLRTYGITGKVRFGAALK